MIGTESFTFISKLVNINGIENKYFMLFFITFTLFYWFISFIFFDLKLHKCVIFSHNLGSFDGYFLFKGLLELPDINIDKVNSVIDDLHRFISIDIVYKDTKLIFKDSLRIFPISLQELTNIFEVEGKLHPYNPKFNKISLFENKDLLNEFKEYSIQDSICLLKALTKAQNIYINEHKVDIATI
jgi:hypothetical protein